MVQEVTKLNSVCGSFVALLIKLRDATAPDRSLPIFLKRKC